MKNENPFVNFNNLFRRIPDAAAVINGSRGYPHIHGLVRFYSVISGVIVRAEISGLLREKGICSSPVFGFHIHSSGDCSRNEGDAFASAMGHYNPGNCPHPYHAGDMPPLFGVKGRAVSVFLTDRFTVKEILDRAVIIHASPDDFKSQPSGDSGERIACGVIVPVARYQH